jgi:hypothetical protein
LRIAACTLTLALALSGASQAAPSNLYEWLAIAPVVVVGENLGTYGKQAEFRIDSYLRGTDTGQSLIRVNVRRANRDRNRRIDKDALRFEKGLSYVLLLSPAATRKANATPVYQLVRGARGAREVPPEGGEVYLEAVRRFVEIQDRKDDVLTWREMSAMLEETNPFLIGTALDQLLKFRRGDSDLLGSVRPLLDHPSHSMRESAALLIGQILEQNGLEPVPDGDSLRSELLAKARRDPVAAMRVAATIALDALSGETTDAILEEIARDDPDQEVRYAAERLIYERGQAGEDAAAGNGGRSRAEEGAD